MNLNYLIWPFVLLLMLGCKEDPELEYGFIDDRLKPYFDEFKKEGELRGLNLNLSPEVIEAFIQNVISQSVAGQCQRNTDRPSQIILDENVWNQSNDSDKEFLIFHELGHCILNRDHLDATNPNGSCISIMHSVVGICRNEYDTRRSDYLDELFN